MAALPEEDRLADLGFSQAYHTTKKGCSSMFAGVRGSATFQMPVADGSDAAYCVPATNGLSHLEPVHAVDKPQAEDHACLVILDGVDVLFQLFLFFGTPRFEMVNPALQVPDFDGQAAAYKAESISRFRSNRSCSL